MFGRRLKRNKANGDRSNGGYQNGNNHLIECRKLVKTYHSPAGDFPALIDVDLQVDGGEFVAVVGKSGSGKSTLVNMITGIDRPSSGEILVGDTSVGGLGEGKLAQWRGRNIGVIFQFFQLLPTLTVIENVMLPMDFCSMYTMRERRERAMHLLEQVGVEEHAYKLPSAVSGGQQQRVAIARAMANDPPILAADEPTGNLDSKTADSIFHLFEGLVEQGKTILMVTHDRDLSRRATRTVMLADGEVIEEFLAQALPALNEQQLIRATRCLERQIYEPGSIIVQEGAPPDRFYLITRGQVEILVGTPAGGSQLVAHLGQGQYFGETELLRGGENMATVRAAPDKGARVVSLDREIFDTMLAESPSTREEMSQVAEARTAENAKGRSGADHA